MKQSRLDIEKMLLREPKASFENELAVWRKMRPLTIDDFQTFWERVEADRPLFDVNVAEFMNWQCWDTDGFRSSGMRHKISKKEYGIVRESCAHGGICEATYKHGQYHGLSRCIQFNEVWIDVWRTNRVVASLCFDSDFKEQSRGGPQAHLLEKVQPSDFA